MGFKLVQKDDQCFFNPFCDSPVSEDPLNPAFKFTIEKYARKLFHDWEINVKKQVDAEGSTGEFNIYTGVCGYALLYLELGIILDNQDYIEQAYFMSEQCSMHLKKKEMTFLTGDGGVLAVAAISSRKMNQPEKEEHYVHRLESMYRSPKLLDPAVEMTDELLYGRAGCLYSLLFVRQYGGIFNQELISYIVNAIIKSGECLAKKFKDEGKSSPPLMYQWHDQQFKDLGSAHGLVGILYMLLQARDQLSKEVLEDKIRPCLDYLLEVRFASGNFPASTDNESDCYVQWCHGAPGFVHCLVKASEVFKSQIYLDAALKCGNVIWERGVVKRGFSLCHGIAGNAFCFLKLYQATGDSLHLHRACQFAQIIIEAPPQEFHTPDHPLSLFEGTAGVIHFLFSLLKPKSSYLPGYEIKD